MIFYNFINIKRFVALNSLNTDTKPVIPQVPPIPPKINIKEDIPKPVPETKKKEETLPPLRPITVPVTFSTSNELKLVKLTAKMSLNFTRNWLQKNLVETQKFQMLLKYLKKRINDFEIKK